MSAGTSAATVPAIASMAPETGGENKSPSARAAARAAAGACGRYRTSDARTGAGNQI